MAEQNVAVLALESLAYATQEPRIQAELKQQVQDFQVDEVLGFDFSGEGDHLCLQIRKTNLTTIDVARRIARITGSRQADVSYAGIKDKVGICTQWFSVKASPAIERRLLQLPTEGLEIIQHCRNHRKLKRGSHQANSFQIRLRNLDGDQQIWQQGLQRIAANGVPNYFGEQRFGHSMSNVHEAFAEIVKPSEFKRKRHSKFKKGIILSAARSYIFNQLLSGRVMQGNWNSFLAGDVLNLDGTNSYFTVPLSQVWDSALQNRLDSGDIHITGLLPGYYDPRDKYLTTDQSKAFEAAFSVEFAAINNGLEQLGVKASRRALRLFPKQFHWRLLDTAECSMTSAPNDLSDSSGAGAIEGSSLELRFSLGSGAYATSVLRELCKLKTGSANRDLL